MGRYFSSTLVFANEMFAPLYAIYVQRIDAAVYHIGGIWSFYVIGYGLLTLVLSRFLNKKRLALHFMTANFCFRIAGWVCYLFADSVWQIYGIQLIFAVGEALGTPCYDLLYSSNLTRGRYASDWGLDKGVTAFVSAVGAFAGGIVVYFYGFTALFFAMIILSSVSIVFAVTFHKSLCGCKT
ncbi:MAG: hypothetical protein ABIF10_01175 [Candidatus Woesearchaeota archaeon]